MAKGSGSAGRGSSSASGALNAATGGVDRRIAAAQASLRRARRELNSTNVALRTGFLPNGRPMSALTRQASSTANAAIQRRIQNLQRIIRGQSNG